MLSANALLLVVTIHLASLHGAVNAQAITSIFMPGFDPQPLAISEVSVSGDHTYWQLGPGSLTGIFSETAFPATATLITGPNDVVVSFVDAQLGTVIDSCTIGADGLTTCLLVEGSATETDTETASPIAVQLVATLTGASAPTSMSQSGKASLTPSPSKPTQASGSGPAPTGAPAPASTSGARGGYTGLSSFALGAAVLLGCACSAAL